MHLERKLNFLFLIMLIAQVLIVWYSFYFYSDHQAILQTASRLSGRLSLLLFSLIFLTYGQSPTAVRSWFNLYFIFAVAHVIHLVELLTYQALAGNLSRLINFRVLGGIIAYVLIVAMPVVQYIRGKGKIAKISLIRLEYFYLVFVWMIFFLTYLPRILGTLTTVGGSYYEFVISFGWLIFMMLFKIVQRVRLLRSASV
jgi:hypothetical protein